MTSNKKLARHGLAHVKKGSHARQPCSRLMRRNAGCAVRKIFHHHLNPVTKQDAK